MTNKVKVALISQLKKACPNVYCGKSATVFPKINLWLKQAEDSTFRARYAAVLDVFTKGIDAEDAEILAENAEKLLTMNKAKIDGGYISVYKSGGGGFVEYKDSEKISHYMDNYEVIFYKEE